MISPENVPLDNTDMEHGVMRNQVREKQHMLSRSLELRVYINRDSRKTCHGPGSLNWQGDFMTLLRLFLE